MTAALRWSSVRDCARKAVYEATRTPDRERTDREERILFRGRRIGRDYADFLRAKNPNATIEVERKVVWPLGTGHIDVYYPETLTAIEVLSSAHASSDMIHSKLLQVAGYVKYDPDAQHLALVILDPSDFTEDRIIVLGGTPEMADLFAEVDERVAQVIAWRDTGDLPARVCMKPGDSWGHFCLHAAHCFDGYEQPPLEQVDTPDARAAALAFAQAKQTESAAKVTYDQAKAVREDVQARLVDLVPVGKVAVGPFEVARTHVVRKSFKLTLAEKDSRLAADLLAEFTSVSEFDTFRIDRVSDDPALTADSFGEEVPWTDADLVTP